MPYLNSAPFFRAWPLGARYELTDGVPAALGAQAAAGELLAGPLPLADYLRLEDRFERLGPFGIAVRGPARSVLLFSRKPLRQLDGAAVAVTEETSTSALLLRLLLEGRYRLTPASYRRGRDPEADALLLIGDEALRFRQTNAQYPFEIDLGFEWWLWQHLPCVFAVWAVRRDLPAQEKKQLELALAHSLALSQGQFPAIAAEAAPVLGIHAAELVRYLEGFAYRLGAFEEEGIRKFRELADAHHLL